MPTFTQQSPSELIQRFPPAPWGMLDPPWQQDEKYQLQTRNLLHGQEWHHLLGELLGFLQTLEVAPSTCFVEPSRQPPAGGDEEDGSQDDHSEQATECDNVEELTDPERMILEAMLENDIASKRRRQTRVF